MRTNVKKSGKYGRVANIAVEYVKLVIIKIIIVKLVFYSSFNLFF